MSQFALDTCVQGNGPRFRVRLSEEWAVWGPNGGYLAALTLRAMAAAGRLRRPATFACQFLRVARFDAAEIRVTLLRRGSRADALRAVLVQDGRPVVAATAWFVEDELPGLEHDAARMPAVPAPDALAGFDEVAEDYEDWSPLWRHIEGRPLRFGEGPGPPVSHAWMRVLGERPRSDAVLDAARSVFWMDFMMWSAASAPHPWPSPYIAPNLDLNVQFHRFAPEHDWLLCESHAPHASRGLMGCQGRLWTPDGELVATGTSQLYCRPNPQLPGPRRARPAVIRGAA